MNQIILSIISAAGGAVGMKFLDGFFKNQGKQLDINAAAAKAEIEAKAVKAKIEAEEAQARLKAAEEERERLWARIGNLEGRLEKAEDALKTKDKEYIELLKAHVALQKDYDYLSTENRKRAAEFEELKAKCNVVTNITS